MGGRWLSGWAIGAALASAVSCGESDSTQPANAGAGGIAGTSGSSGGPSAGGTFGGNSGSGGADAASGDAPSDTCLTNELPLTITLADGVADSQVVPVRYKGQDGWLGLDTGSATTFVFGDPGGPEYVPDAGEIELGCEKLPVSSRRLEAIGVEYFADKPILGILGLDFFQSQLSEIDYPDRRVARYRDNPAPPTQLLQVHAILKNDRVLLDLSIDATALTLIYDVGAHDTLWVGVPGKPGDLQTELGFADGSTVTAWAGTGLLAVATETRSIPVVRTPTLPYLEDELVELGAQGLFGMTGMAFRRIVFDLSHERLLLGPVVAEH